ncbi:MAG: serine/threonine-protein phosphatase [Planctomycetes bacterium]|nr:serine/threonine-protein phosphatase [Planctomycetota bacterium]
MSLMSLPRVVVFGNDAEKRQRIEGLLHARGLIATGCPLEASTPALHAGLLAVLLADDAGTSAAANRLAQLVEQLRNAEIPTLVWGAGISGTGASGRGQQVDVLSPDTTLEEVVGRLTTLAQYVPLVRCLDEELRHLQRLGHQLNRYISELDHDMQLAGRLQRDFMPRSLPVVDGIKFSYLFRPATFVSGDIFDIIPLDERRAGMFIADAMGHGTAAGLITMFLRKALVARIGAGSNTRVLSPVEAMRQMHEGLSRHELPNANFVTAAYAVVDAATREVHLARGGHPHPLRISADGAISELICEGGLLGLADLPPELSELSIRLDPGDKIVFYTDGLESLFLESREIEPVRANFTERLREWARLGLMDFTDAIGAHLDRQVGSLNPEDDITIVALEFAR